VSGLRLFVDGISMWSATLPGWAQARAALRSPAWSAAAAAMPRPAATLLSANSRRRAPDSVLVALQVGQEATQQSGQDPAGLASVFASAHGDLAIVEALCSTLAADPLLLSPTRFHHSVHNAASGYWAIATGCRAPSSAVAGHEHSFAIGWVEATSLAAADARPVLLVGFETEARGALAGLHRSQGLLGVALVLATSRSAASQWQVDAAWDAAARAASPLRTAAGRALAGNALAGALPLFEALAGDAPARVNLPLAAGPGLALRLMPLSQAALDRGGTSEA
jgi:hypothetical protein